MHLASKQLPQVASAFEEFLAVHGQAQILKQLDQSGRLRRTRKQPARRPAKRSRKTTE